MAHKQTVTFTSWPWLLAFYCITSIFVKATLPLILKAREQSFISYGMAHFLSELGEAWWLEVDRKRKFYFRPKTDTETESR